MNQCHRVEARGGEIGNYEEQYAPKDATWKVASGNLQNGKIKEKWILVHSESPVRCDNEGCRTLFSDTTTNIENYVRQRIFKVDQLQLQDGGKEALFQRLQALSRPEEARIILTVIIDSLHSAETEEECCTIESVLKLLSPKDESERQELHFGAVLFRMYHFLGMPERALAIYQDPQLKKLVEDITCHMLLMDLLYKHKQYHNVLSVFAGLPKYDSNCYTLACGALYHINTLESHEHSQALICKIKQSGLTLQRRAVIFCMMLALKQEKAKEALSYLSLCKHSNITRNIELMCRCKLRHFEEICLILDGTLIDAKNSTRFMTKRIYHDTWLEIQSAMMTNDTPYLKRLQELETRLCQSSLLSLQKISVLLERTIPGRKDYKRERAKRIIERSKPH